MKRAFVILSNVFLCFVGVLPSSCLFFFLTPADCFRPTNLAIRHRLLVKPPLHVVAMGPVETFDYCLANYQLPTESTISACLAAIGDSAAQLRSLSDGDKETFDWRRWQAFFVKGAVAGVLWSKWYSIIEPVGISLSQSLAPTDALEDPIRIVFSVFMDLFVFCPFLFCTWDLPFPMLARGDPIDSIPRKIKAKIGTVLEENTKVWMIPNLVIYSLPMHYRVVVTSCIDAVWQMMLSDQLAKPLPPPPLLVPSSSDTFEPVPGALPRMENLVEQTQ